MPAVCAAGWNIERGYLTGEDAAAFSAAEAQGAGADAAVGEYASGDRGRECGEWLCIEGRLDSVVKVLGLAGKTPGRGFALAAPKSIEEAQDRGRA